MKSTVKVQQNHNNLMITIPKVIKEKLDIQKGEILLIEVQEDGSLKITR